MRRFVRGALGLIALACMGWWASCASMQEIRLGVAGPLSGEQATLGQDVLNGVTLAVEEWNAKGGVLGRKITLIPVDDENNPDKAKEAAYYLSRKKPLVVIGHVDSGCSLAAAKTYQDNDVVMICPTSTSPRLTEGGMDHVFRVCGRDDFQGRAAAVWLIKHYPQRTVAVVSDNSEYGRGLADEFVRNYEFLSARKVLLREEVKRGDPTLEPALTKCLEARPDLVFFGGLANQGGAFLKALRQHGSLAVFMGGDGCFGKPFLDAAGTEVATGALVVFYPDFSELPGTRTRTFLEAYQGRFKAPPGPFAIFGYKAAQVALAAVGQAGVPINGRTISQALHRLTFETVFGLLRFTDKGDPVDVPLSVWVVEEGQFKEIGGG
ncbi:MAG: branched-chain amino acid ABC transporter substrate-binding protein [Acidobacteriota bacterium]